MNEDKTIVTDTFSETIEVIKRFIFFNADELKKNEDSQIRSNAVGCLQSVASAAPKLLYPHWNHLLLDSHASMPSTPSLFTLIQYEAMPEVRISACSIIKTMDLNNICDC
ncbi:hypothetical protein C2G38_2249811 [Gigaspora rosea]|uniref:DUF4042 domain-containing protein n=1 Tax=Gigaspora rosea TaxID=44941 RepID=A0A397UXI1_9GLOM|nr:hypothetical protein C2G38_2249811 [Gigaspora rosea]